MVVPTGKKSTLSKKLRRSFFNAVRHPVLTEKNGPKATVAYTVGNVLMILNGFNTGALEIASGAFLLIATLCLAKKTQDNDLWDKISGGFCLPGGALWGCTGVSELLSSASNTTDVVVRLATGLLLMYQGAQFLRGNKEKVNLHSLKKGSLSAHFKNWNHKYNIFMPTLMDIPTNLGFIASGIITKNPIYAAIGLAFMFGSVFHALSDNNFRKDVLNIDMPDSMKLNKK